MTTTRFFNFQPKTGNNTSLICLPIPLNGRTVSLAVVADSILQSPKQLRAQIMRPRSSSSNAASPGSFFLRITVGSKRCRPSAALSGNVLRVGECASFSPMWRSRASDWPLRLPICTWPSCRGVELSPFLYVQSKHQEFARKAWRSL